MSECPIQPQFDIVGAAKTAAVTVALVVQNINRLQRLCYKEDVQPLVIPPLERLGQWLMVDPERLDQGDNAWQSRPKPKLLSLSSLSFVVGLSADADGDLASTIGRNTYLIASHLLLGACATCLQTEDSAKILHELMRLSGTLNDYPIPMSMVRQFAEVVNGYHDHMQGDTAAKLYTTLCVTMHQVIARNSRPNADLEFLHGRISDAREIAAIVYEVIEGLKDSEVELIELRGVRQGILLACLFIWLRPKEVQVVAWGCPVYPDHFPQYMISTRTPPRLSIHIGPLKDAHNERGNPSPWQIQIWRGTTGGLPILINLNVADHSSFDSDMPHMAVPIQSTKALMVSKGYPESSVVASGILAAAFVTICTDRGCLTGPFGAQSRPLRELCSMSFLSSYNTIISTFGWAELLDVNHDAWKARVVETLCSVLDAGLNMRRLDPESPDVILHDLMEKASAAHRLKHQTPMLQSTTDCEAPEDLVWVTETAVELAGQALLFAITNDIPLSARFSTRQHVSFRHHCATISRFLCGPAESVQFWEFRLRAIEMLLPGPVRKSQQKYLAVERNGWVAYSGALANWDDKLTEPRDVVVFHVAPGPLKSDKVDGRISRVVDDLDNEMVVNITSLGPPEKLDLGRGERFIDEYEAASNQKSEIHHLWRVSSNRSPSTLLIATYISARPDCDEGIARDDRISTSWASSIEAIAFARHLGLDGHKLSLDSANVDQGLTGLDVKWLRLGSRPLNWSRHVAMTSQSEQLRFLQAGLVYDSGPKPVFIRHQSTPLAECIKEVVQWQNDHGGKTDASWVIIA